MPPKTPLKDLVICVCGDFGKGRSRAQMKTWIEINGAEYVTRLTENVTHVVCSEEQFKPDNKLIENAHLRGKVSIVTYDWLEDSVIARRKLSTKKYEWVKIMKEKQKQKSVRKKTEAKKLKKDAEAFKNGVEAAKSDINSGESDLEADASLSMNKMVFNAFMDQEDLKNAARKAEKAKERAVKVKAQASTAKKRKLEQKAAQSTEDSGQSPPKKTHTAQGKQPAPAAEPTGMHKREKSPVTKEPALERYGLKRPRKARPKITGFVDGVAIRMVEQPKVDPAKIRPAPTRDQEIARIREIELQEANTIWPFPENYHVYRDSGSGLDYALVLARVVDIVPDIPPERVFLRMYESNTEPAKYATCFKRIFSNLQVVETTLAPLGSNFEIAFLKFCQQFKEFTYIDWSNRNLATVKVGHMPKAQKFVKMTGEEVTEIPLVWLPSQPVN